MLQNAKLCFITLCFSCRSIIMSVLPPVRKDRIIGQLPKVHALHTMHWCSRYCLFWNPSKPNHLKSISSTECYNIHSCCSASTKVLLWTQWMNSTARWRRLVSSRGQELWGEVLAFVESVVSGDFQNCLDGLSSIVLSSAFSRFCPVGLRSPRSL